MHGQLAELKQYIYKPLIDLFDELKTTTNNTKLEGVAP